MAYEQIRKMYLPSSNRALSMHEHRLRFYSQTDAVERGFLAPFQGASLVGGWFLGLKPQAVSWSPFGARNQMSKLQALRAAYNVDNFGAVVHLLT
jgi:hypothetical protein